MTASESAAASDDDLDAEMRRLERRMYELDWRDPERVEIVRRYNAVCDQLGVPSGDKC